MKLKAELPKDERILIAAEQVFSKHGYERATLDEVISLADVGKGTVYKYFGNKEQLFYKLVAAKNVPFVELLHGSQAGRTVFKERLELYFRDIIRFHRANAPLWQIIYFDMMGCKHGCRAVLENGKTKVVPLYAMEPSEELVEQIVRYHNLIVAEMLPLMDILQQGVNEHIIKSGDIEARACHLFFGIVMTVFYPQGSINQLSPEELAALIVDRFLYGELLV